MPYTKTNALRHACAVRGEIHVPLLIALSLAASAAGASTPGDAATARLMIEFAQPPADAASFGQRFGQRFGLRLLRYHPSARLYVYEVQAGRDPVSVVARLAADPAVAHVELDQLLHTENQP